MLWIALLAVGPGLIQYPAASGPKTIVIDPGHGGRDTGAAGPTGTQEKTICLSLAKLLAQNLTPAYNVVLTRSDDYSLNNLQRTAMANHEKADLFISLHTGAAFIRTASGMAVYTYQPAAKDEEDRRPAADNRPSSWQQLQLAHMVQSRALAEALRHALATLDRAGAFQVQQGPLAVLVGADMPAVLLEIGQLSNPETEKTLNSNDQLRAYARAIHGAIDGYFSSRPQIEP